MVSSSVPTSLSVPAAMPSGRSVVSLHTRSIDEWCKKAMDKSKDRKGRTFRWEWMTLILYSIYDGMQISYCVCSQVPREGPLLRKESINRKNTAEIAVLHFMGYLKGEGSTMLYEQLGELNYKV